MNAGAEVERLRALIDRILSLSDFTAAQQDRIRREAGLGEEEATGELPILADDVDRCPAHIGIYKPGYDDRCRYRAGHEGHHQTTAGHFWASAL